MLVVSPTGADDLLGAVVTHRLFHHFAWGVMGLQCFIGAVSLHNS